MGLSGAKLLDAVKNSSDEFGTLIDGLLADGGLHCYYADDGVGKSILTLQMALEASMGIPVFDYYEVERPLKVVYVQTERLPNEIQIRLKNMMQKRVGGLENFYHEWELQDVEISKAEHRTHVVQRLKKVKEEFGTFDWLHIDPIYAWTSKDIATYEGTAGINALMRVLQTEVCGTVSYNHHTTVGIPDAKNGGRRIGKKMYGGRFLSANMVGSFHIEKNGNNGTLWTADKNTHKALAKSVSLVYDDMHYLSYVDPDKAFESAKDRAEHFIRVCKKTERAFTFKQFADEIGVCDKYARTLIRTHLGKSSIICVNPSKKIHLYKSG